MHTTSVRILVPLLLPLTLSCQKAEPIRPEVVPLAAPPQARILSAEPALLAGAQWGTDEECRGRTFLFSADLYYVHGESPDVGGDDKLTLQISPDFEMGAGDVFFVRTPTGTLDLVRTDGLLSVVLSDVPSLSDGQTTTRIRLGRRGPWAGRHDCLGEIRVQSGDRSTAVFEHPDSSYAAAFARFGATGVDRTKRSGTLVLGSAALRLECPAPTCEVVAENPSSAGATWTSSSTSGPAIGLSVGARSPTLSFAVNDTLTIDNPQHGAVLISRPVPAIRGVDPKLPQTVVLVSLDTTRRDALALYGGPAQTPFLLEFADTSTTFDNAWATAPWTLPSHSSMFTGLFPTRHRAGTYEGFLDEQWTFVEALVQQGYYALGLPGGALMASGFGVARSFHEYHDPLAWETPGRELLSIAEEVLSQREGQPLFIFLNLFEPHSTYRAPGRFRKLYRPAEALARVQDPRLHRLAAGDSSAWGELILEPPTEEAAFEYLRRAYYAEITYVDQLFGRLIESLRSASRYDDALILVTADHGELFGESGLVSHGGVLDPELTAIPMLLKLPGQQRAERRTELVSLVDVAATVADVLRLSTPRIDGHSLLDPALLQERRFVVSEEHEHWVHPLFPSMRYAAHAFVLQRSADREVLWQGGAICESLTNGVWSERTCSDPDTRLQTLVDLLGTELGSQDAQQGAMPAEQEAILRQLGYVQ